MPISDTYVVQYLLQETRADCNTILWAEAEVGGYVAHVRGIRVDLLSIPERAGPRLWLTLSSVAEKIQIHEPQSRGVFKPKYESDDEGQLARLLRELAYTVQCQCTARRNRPSEMMTGVRQSIYGRLIGLTGTEI